MDKETIDVFTVLGVVLSMLAVFYVGYLVGNSERRKDKESQ